MSELTLKISAPTSTIDSMNMGSEGTQREISDISICGVIHTFDVPINSGDCIDNLEGYGTIYECFINKIASSIDINYFNTMGTCVINSVSVGKDIYDNFSIDIVLKNDVENCCINCVDRWEFNNLFSVNSVPINSFSLSADYIECTDSSIIEINNSIIKINNPVNGCCSDQLYENDNCTLKEVKIKLYKWLEDNKYYSEKQTQKLTVFDKLGSYDKNREHVFMYSKLLNLINTLYYIRYSMECSGNDYTKYMSDRKIKDIIQYWAKNNIDVKCLFDFAFKHKCEPKSEYFISEPTLPEPTLPDCCSLNFYQNQYVNLGQNPIEPGSDNEFIISSWVYNNPPYINDPIGGAAAIISTAEDSDNCSISNTSIITLGITYNNKFILLVVNYNSLNNYVYLIESDNQIPSNQWIHLAISKETIEGENKFKLYLNGSFISSSVSYGTEPPTNTYSYDSNTNLKLGIDSACPGRTPDYFRGKLSNVVIVQNTANNQNKSNSQIIQDIYNAGKCPDYNAIKSNIGNLTFEAWPLNEKQGNITQNYDETKQGTLNGWNAAQLLEEGSVGQSTDYAWLCDD